jgi:hypothetical protein
MFPSNSMLLVMLVRIHLPRRNPGIGVKALAVLRINPTRAGTRE